MKLGGRANAAAALALGFAAVVAVAVLVVAFAPRRRRRRGVGVARRRCRDLEDAKPQYKFKHVLADNSYSPFKHLQTEDARVEGPTKEVHPYKEAISSLLDHPAAPSTLNDHRCSVEHTSYNWVCREDQLESLVDVLGKEKAFAVDTEQHSLRSFLGYTALIQISTCNEDFLIDTIALHDVMGILRPVFADPAICKIFHGADNDIIWLQRDFHIYVVNMFDTAKACEVLSKPQKSLAYLLETYCGVSTDKTLQREDWRLRPLSEEMIEYACTDAHYLLFIASCLILELHAKSCDTSASPDDKRNFFFEASRRSNMICLQLYNKEIESTPGASAAASIFSRNLLVQRLEASKISLMKDLVLKMCTWRDLMARFHDESIRFVLSDQAIIALVTNMPRTSSEAHDIIAMAETNHLNMSSPSPSYVVQAHIEDLFYFFDESKSSIDVFSMFLDKQDYMSRFCRLSIYNYSLVSQLRLKQVNMLTFADNAEKLTATSTKRSSRELFIKKFSCKSPVYHNCRIYANDGRLLCYCDRKKLEWYLQRNLAKLIEDDPPGIVLLFDPKGRPEDEDNEFYVQSKKNICVGCGEGNHYVRYRIIPSCYRIHFPEHLKSHRSHDIVLVCVDCHEAAHSAAEKYKKKIAEEFGIPLFAHKIVHSDDKSVETSKSITIGERGVSPLQLRTAAMALLRHGSRMPASRREELIETVKSYYGGKEVTSEDLEAALLVGMSSQERRRLEKKRGMPFQNGASTITNGSSAAACAHENSESSSLRDPSNCSDLLEGEIAISTPGRVDQAKTNSSIHNPIVAPNTSTSEKIDNDDEDYNAFGNGDASSLAEGVLSENDKRLSMLGHGLHGKRVVEYLLSNFGEEGILDFCQRWRHVFVEAINPRFLPSGWNIKHSGRRDFGDYSVYNPTKKVPQAIS